MAFLAAKRVLGAAVLIASAAAVAGVAALSPPVTPGGAAPKDRLVTDVMPFPRADRPVRLFYCTHSAGFRHPVLPQTREIMERLGRELDWLEVEVSDDITVLDAEKLKTLDAVMLYTTGRLPLDTQMLTEWVRAGGALIGVHSATDTLADDEVYVSKIGGVFDGHPWDEPVTILVDHPEHPAMDPFLAGQPRAAGGRNAFTIADEIYQFRTLNPDNVVLMRLDPGTPGAEQGREYPLAWVRESGGGRVFYTALGHRPTVWCDWRFLRHILYGIIWATARCEHCDSKADVLPIMYGRPGPGLVERANRGEMLWGGCGEREQRFGIACRACARQEP